jgi:hypothetical protein
MTPDLERAAVGLALSQGWLTPARLREALLLLEHLRATGRQADLVPLLASRFLRPEHARELERRLGTRLSGAPPPVLAQDLERSADLVRRPAEHDPAGVRQFLGALPGLAQLARNDTVSLAAAPGAARAASPAPASGGILPRPAAVPQRLGPYEVIRELARGGMGAVYVARHTTLDRQVALKVLLGLDAGRLKRFEIEARATAKLRHPNIVPIHEVGEDQGVRFLVMDLIEGVSLEGKVDRDGPLAPVEAARITARIARALDYAHGRGVLHRDMKPSNVLLDGEGQPLVTDFGLAKEAEGEDQLTKTGQLIGTPVYMPPEQATGARDRIDARSDVYSVGATLYHMLTGGPPFQGDHLMNVVVAVVREPPEPPSRRRPGLDRGLEAICLRCLEKDPAARYPTAGALADDLERWLAAQETGAPRGGADRRLVAPLVALALLLGAGAAWLGLELRTVRRARDAQSRGLALLAGAAAGSVDAARASESLEEALRLDPSLRQARVALARLALDDAPPRLDAAEALLAPLAGDAAGAPPEVALLLGRLALARGRVAEALLALEAAAAGAPGEVLRPDVARRLAGARALDRQARGWSAAAEAAWWDALRAAPLDAAPLAALARLRLEAHDVGGAARLWEEAHRRLGRRGERDLQQRLADEAPAVARALRDPQTDPRERARAVLFAPALLREEVTSALRTLAEDPAQPLLREAARAGLLAQAAATGAGEAARRAAFAAWVAGVDAAQDDDAAALQAITLLEHAAWLEAADREQVERLARARSPRVRAALALGVVVSTTRDGGLALDPARALLRGLAGDTAAQVADTARVALGALDALAGAADGADERAVLLACRLARLPGLAPPFLQPGHEPALARALERAPSAALWVARAQDAVERGDADVAARAVDAALALDPACAPALELRAQLALLGQGEPAEGDPFAAVADPEAARAARARVEFTRRHGVAALPAPAGALRAVVSLRSGAWPRVTDDALTVHDSPDARRTDHGLESRRPLNVRTKFAFSAWHSLRYEWSGSWDKVLLWLHASHDAGVSQGLLAHFAPSNGDCFFGLDHVLLGERRGAERPCSDHAVAALSRTGAALFLDDRASYRVHVPARERVSAGTAAAELPFGRVRLRALVVEGVWDPEVGAPSPPDGARRRAFEAALVPLDGRAPVATEHRDLPPPRDLAAARSEQIVLFARGKWLMNDRRAEALYVPEVTGDLEVRARVTFPGSPDRHAGIMLRSSRSRGDALLLGPLGDPQDFTIGITTHRDLQWEKWLRADAWSPERPVHLALQRLGDWVIARCGPEADRLEDFGPPLYFPFDGAVDVGLFARNGTEQQPMLAARFDAFDVRIVR